MENSEVKPVQPNDYLTVVYKLADEEGRPQPKELFMSAGLIRRLASISQSHQGLIDIYTDPSMQSFMLSEILKPRTKRGEPSLEYQLEDFDISTSEAKKVIDWAIQHIIYFFIDAVSSVKAAAMDKESNLTKLAASMTGSPASQEEKQSAGRLIEN